MSNRSPVGEVPDQVDFPGLGDFGIADTALIQRIAALRRGLPVEERAGDEPADPADMAAGTATDEAFDIDGDDSLNANERPSCVDDARVDGSTHHFGASASDSLPQAIRRVSGHDQQRRQIPFISSRKVRAVACLALATALVGFGADKLFGGTNQLDADTTVRAWATDNGAPNILSPLEQDIRNAVNGSDASVPITHIGPGGKATVTYVNPSRTQPELVEGLEAVMLTDGSDPIVDNPYVPSGSEGVVPMETKVFDQLVETVDQDRRHADEPSLPLVSMIQTATLVDGKVAISHIRQTEGKKNLALYIEQGDPQTNLDTADLLLNEAFEQWSGGDLNKPVTSGFFANYFKLAGEYAGISEDKITEFVQQNLALLKSFDSPNCTTWADMTVNKKSEFMQWLKQVAIDQSTFGLTATNG